MSKPLSDKAYVKAGGGRCPACGSGDIEGESFDCDGIYVSQEVNCLECEAEWIDSYTLTGYFDLIIPEKETDDD